MARVTDVDMAALAEALDEGLPVVVIDVRTHRNWWRSSKKIPTAVREDPSRVDQWFQKYSTNQTLIFYCS